MRYQGKITNWKDDKGFGFIIPNDGGNQVFVHIKSFVNRQRRPIGNEIVAYTLKIDAMGRLQAESVTFADDHNIIILLSMRSNSPLILAFAFLFFMVLLAMAGKLPFVVLGLYLLASIVTFVAYHIDKSAARNDQRRTQESTLHFFALIGGWPGALAAQRLLRHKSKKLSFQIVFWITVVLNCGSLGWICSPSGVGTFLSLLGVE
jgi:uncharacterized membrane protein YsdA (DUF1294 family)/cold shock CspA family protein